MVQETQDTSNKIYTHKTDVTPSLNILVVPEQTQQGNWNKIIKDRVEIGKKKTMN